MKTRQELIEEAKVFGESQWPYAWAVEMADFALQVQAEAIADERRRVLEAVDRQLSIEQYAGINRRAIANDILSALRKEIQEEA